MLVSSSQIVHQYVQLKGETWLCITALLEHRNLDPDWDPRLATDVSVELHFQGENNYCLFLWSAPFQFGKYAYIVSQLEIGPIKYPTNI